METSSTRDGKIRFRIKVLKTNLFRKGVLGRIRLPDTESNKYAQGRDGQAYPYFMPWLSGDGGSYSIFPPSIPLLITLRKKFIKVNSLPVNPAHFHQLRSFNTIV